MSDGSMLHWILFIWTKLTKTVLTVWQMLCILNICHITAWLKKKTITFSLFALYMNLGQLFRIHTTSKTIHILKVSFSIKPNEMSIMALRTYIKITKVFFKLIFLYDLSCYQINQHFYAPVHNQKHFKIVLLVHKYLLYLLC